MTTHTQGPWHVAKTGNHQGLIVAEGSGANIAVTYDKADAPLIAAAPELYEALHAVMHGQLGGKPDMTADRFHLARRALAKAEGREP